VHQGSLGMNVPHVTHLSDLGFDYSSSAHHFGSGSILAFQRYYMGEHYVFAQELICPLIERT